MANSNEGPPIRLRPRRSKRNPNDDPRRYAGVVGAVLRFAQMTKRARRRSQSQAEAIRQFRSSRLLSQRVSVRVTYTKNKNQGQWKAHGRYIARDTATHGVDPFRAGFDTTRTDINIASVLDSWQRAGDERLFKVIVSPEFGERLNLQDHTRKLVQCMERDLKTRLEWVAAVHFNTEHPHVHIALRGKDQNGCALVIARDYIRSGIRSHAENLATKALGARTELDAEEARQREITQARYTSLDRIIQRANYGQSSFTITTDITAPGLCDRERRLQKDLSARLAHLEKMGLAKSVGSQQWGVQSDFETVLRTLQRTVDRQKMLAAHGALISDPRLPFEITNIRNLNNLPSIEISDYGDADALLKNRGLMNKQARTLLKRGITLDQGLWGGWLGQYHKTLLVTDERQALFGKERSTQKSSGRERQVSAIVNTPSRSDGDRSLVEAHFRVRYISYVMDQCGAPVIPCRGPETSGNT